MSKPFQRNLEEETVGESVTLDIVRRRGESWGIELCGEGPTEIRRVRAGGPADYAGLQAGDIVLMANGINVTRFGHQQVAQIIAESEKFLRLKVLPDESSSEGETDEDEEVDDEGKPKLKQPKAKKDSWWATEKEEENETKEEKPDMTDFETFSNNFDKIEKQHRKAGKAMVKGGSKKKSRKGGHSDDDDDADSDDEYAKFMRMKQKMIEKGKVSASESEGSGDDEFAEFMRWKQQKRRAARRGHDDWDQDDWGGPPKDTRPVNRSSSSGYSSGYNSGPNRNAVRGQTIAYRGSNIEQGNFIIDANGVKQFDKNYVLGEDNTFKGDKAAVAGAFTGDHNVIFNDEEEGQAAGDIKGVRNRVKAGIMHFNYEDENKEVPEEDQDKVVIYTTSLGVNRELVANCNRAIQIIRSYKVRYEERDIFNFEQHKEGLWERLGLDRDSKFPPMPRIYIDGIYIGGINELEATSDCGDLRIRLQHFSKFQDRRHCQYCHGSGRVACRTCGGHRVQVKNDFTELQCSNCDKDGTNECRECIESVDLY